MRWRRIGVIDVGSNSVRLVVYDVRGRAMQPRFNEKVLAGLGRGLNSSGKLSKEGVELAVAALTRFAAITRAQKVDTLFAFATAAVREAGDGKAFCERVKKEAGLTLRILTGGDEARYAAQGVLAGSPVVDGIVGDLGGSSLELARLKNGQYDGGSTYPLGPLALDAGGSFNADKIGARIRDILSGAPELKKTGDTFYAVGGAWRSIATLHMELTRAPLHMLQNYEIEASKLVALLDELMAGKKHSDLVQEVAKRRGATIPYAAAVLAACARASSSTTWTRPNGWKTRLRQASMRLSPGTIRRPSSVRRWSIGWRKPGPTRCPRACAPLPAAWWTSARCCIRITAPISPSILSRARPCRASRTRTAPRWRWPSPRASSAA
jgi:exopolyphosphatase/guanosine-5'-triphosphate,3'-diphosphate pyrophosphatase